MGYWFLHRGGLTLCLIVCATISFAQGVPLDRDRYWISHEKISSGVDNCRTGTCPEVREFTTRLFDPRRKEQLSRLMSLLDFQSAAHGVPLEHPETPQFCAHTIPSPEQAIWNPEWMHMSNKLEALRGLEGLYVDVSGLKAPLGFEGEFGPALQRDLETKFSAAGIRMVNKEQVEFIPGKPKLSVFFSTTNPDTGCWWSVFATMTQSAILTRDINVKLNVGSWAFMKGFDPDNLALTEYEAITQVFDGFVKDFRAANDPEFVPVNIPPYFALDGSPMTAPKVSVQSYDDIVALGLNVVPDDGAKGTLAEESAVVEEFSPAAMKPELSPKALKRLRADTGGDAGDSDASVIEALEKLTTTGSS